MHPRTHEVLEYLDQQRDVLRAAVASVGPAFRERTPPDGGWSVANVIEHLAIAEKRIAMRMAASIGEARAAGIGPETSTEPILPTVSFGRIQDRGAKISAPEAIRPTGLSASAAQAALEDSWRIVRGTLTDADGLAIGMLAMPHPVFGAMSLYQWFAFIGSHEARHAAQIREIGTAVTSH